MATENVEGTPLRKTTTPANFQPFQTLNRPKSKIHDKLHGSWNNITGQLF